MLALLSLIPARDWLYTAIIVFLVMLGIYERNHLINEGKAHELAQIQTASRRVETEAEKNIAALTNAHIDDVTKVKATYEKQLSDLNAQHDSDAQRLREYDAYRRAHQVVDSAPARLAAAQPGASGPSADEQRYESLEDVALKLATAGANVSAALTACVNDRQSLTGK